MIPKPLKYHSFIQSLSIVLVGMVGFSTAMAADKVRQKFSIAENAEIHFLNLRGDVEFKGWEQSTLVVEGVLDEESTGLLIEESAKGYLIKVKLPRHLSPKKGSKLLVRLPHSAAIYAQGVSTNWTFSNVGSTTINSVSGEIELKKSSGDVSLDVVSGPVLVDSVKGDLMVTSLSGKIDVENVEGKTTLSTVEGELNFKQPIIENVRLSSINGEIFVEGLMAEKGNLSVSSVDGDVFLKVGTSESLNCNLTALHGGEIKNYLKVAGEESSNFSGKHLSLIVGKGGAVVEATTISGTIHLQD